MKVFKSMLTLGLVFFLSNLVCAQDWMNDFDLAKKRAQNESKNIVLVFAGSDWCAPCIKLEKDIWESKEFKNYSNENYVLVKADFPRQKKNRLSKEQQAHNDLLAEKYNMEGYFPLVVVLSTEGKILGKTGYKKVNPTEYISLLSSFVK